MSFIPGFNPPSNAGETALWFLYQNNKLLIKVEDDNYSILQASDLKEFDPAPLDQQYLGSLDGRPCYAAELSDDILFSDIFSLKGIRALFGRLDAGLVLIAGVANQLVLWNKNHLFCGKCGNPTENRADERAKYCPLCDLINYPRLSPAIIVAVIKGNQILLARSQRLPARFYSVLAGFVEPGEMLEECVKREIREEVGIAVKNISYFGSQPWPFPDSLMIAFTAEYAGGELSIDNSEILDAGWFSADSLPVVPPRISIARQLIDWFLEKNHKNE